MIDLNSPTVAYIFFIAVIALLAFLAARSLMRLSRKSEPKLDVSTFGFLPIEQPGPDLLERVETAHQAMPGQKLALSRVFQRAILGGKVYLFDYSNATRSSIPTEGQGQGVLAVVSPELRLPFFHLIAQPERRLEGFVAVETAAQKVLDWTISKIKLVRVYFPESPDFDRRYMILGQDEYEIRRFFNEKRIAFLCGLTRSYNIEAGQDTFLLVRGIVYSRQVRSQPGLEDGEMIEWLLSDAKGLLEAFRA